ADRGIAAGDQQAYAVSGQHVAVDLELAVLRAGRAEFGDVPALVRLDVFRRVARDVPGEGFSDLRVERFRDFRLAGVLLGNRLADLFGIEFQPGLERADVVGGGRLDRGAGGDAEGNHVVDGDPLLVADRPA